MDTLVEVWIAENFHLLNENALAKMRPSEQAKIDDVYTHSAQSTAPAPWRRTLDPTHDMSEIH